jgi:hypothetical protein
MRLVLAIALLTFLGSSAASGSYTWDVKQIGNDLQLCYGTNGIQPQFGSFDLGSGYLRLNYGPGSTWGTSVIVLPSFWEYDPDLHYRQGAPISAFTATVIGEDLAIDFTSTISELTVKGRITLHPPAGYDILRNPELAREMVAEVEITEVTGDVSLQNRYGEAFKPVMLSSMHVSGTSWDTNYAFITGRVLHSAGLRPWNIKTRVYAIPDDEWIINPPVYGNVFGLEGGFSDWQKENADLPAPKITIIADDVYLVTGWVTYDTNPNDDNVGFWAATDDVIRSWRYTIVASPASPRPIDRQRRFLRLR